MAKISFSIAQKPQGKQGILRPDGQGYYEQIIGALNVENSGGIFYTAKQSVLDLFNRSSTFKRKMERGVLRAEAGHPKFVPGMSKAEFVNRIYQIYEENTCAQFKEIWLDDTILKGPNGTKIWAIMAKFTPSGSRADFLAKQLQNPDENVCFSIRSIAEDYREGGRYARDIVEIVTFDYVNEPGIVYAEKYRSPSLESFTKGGDILVTPQDFIEASKLATQMGIATESAIDLKIDTLFKQFGWSKPINKPGYMDL